MEQYSNIMDFNKHTTKELERLEKEVVENHEKIKDKIILFVDEIEVLKNKINDHEVDLGLYEKIYKEIREVLKTR